MEGALCIFQSAILQTEIQFKKAKNDAKTAIFVIRKEMIITDAFSLMMELKPVHIRECTK